MESTEKVLLRKRPAQSGQMSRLLRVILLSVILGEAVTMGMLFLFAMLLCRVNLLPVFTDILAAAAAAAGALAAGFACGRLRGEKGLLSGAICGGALLTVLLLAGIGFSQEPSPIFLCVKAGVILASAVLGGVLGVNRANRKKRIKY